MGVLETIFKRPKAKKVVVISLCWTVIPGFHDI